MIGGMAVTGMFRSLLELGRRHISNFARDAALRLVLVVAALVFLSLALAFGGIALFLWLATMMPPALAGLSVAGAALFIALICLLVASRKRRPAVPPVAVPPAGQEGIEIEQAEALGRMIGRDLKGFPLVIAALMVGMIAGRWRR